MSQKSWECSDGEPLSGWMSMYTQKDAFGEGAVELIFIAMLCNSNAHIMKKILHIHIHA